MGKPQIKQHTLIATVVLIAAAVWIATGEFSFVGSDVSPDVRVQPATSDTSDNTTEPLQTVAYIVAEPEQHDRIIRLSGETTADKRVVLVARTSGVVAGLPAAEGSSIAEDDVVMVLDGKDRLAALASAEAQFRLADH